MGRFQIQFQPRHFQDLLNSFNSALVAFGFSALDSDEHKSMSFVSRRNRLSIDHGSFFSGPSLSSGRILSNSAQAEWEREIAHMMVTKKVSEVDEGRTGCYLMI